VHAEGAGAAAATVTVTDDGGDPGGTTGGEPTDEPTTPTATPTDQPTSTPSPSGSEPGEPGDDGGPDAVTGEEVQVPYACRTPIGDRTATSPVRIDARRDGGSFALTVRFRGSVMDSPADIPEGSVKPSMEVVLGGADRGTVRVEGPVNAEDIKAGDPIAIPDLTGTYRPGASGRSTLAPGVLKVEALGTTTTCTPQKSLVSLTLDTTAQEGGASGGGTAGGAAGGAAGGSSAVAGGLAATGADDHGSLRALGLVGGTLLLLGGAVFTFLPGRPR